MATFIFLWNAQAWPEGDVWHHRAVAHATPDTPVLEPWNTGSRRGGFAAGDTAMLLRVRRERGLVASGTLTGEMSERVFADHGGKVVRYVDIGFEHVLAVEDRIPTESLPSLVPGVNWGRIQSSGVRVRDDAEATLHRVWADHLRSRSR